MSTRTTGLDLRLTGDSNIINKLKEIKQLGIDLRNKAIKIAIDGHDKLDKAAKSAAEMGKKAEEAGNKANKAMKHAADGAKEAEKGFDSVMDVFQNGIPNALDKLDKQIVGSVSKMTGISKNMTAIGLAAGAAIATGVGTAMGIAVVKAADFEDAMIRVNKMIGMEGAEAKNVGKDVQAMMKMTGQGLAPVTAVYENAGSMGIGADKVKAGDMAGAREEITEYVKTTLMASQSFKMGTDETATAMGNMANVYRTKTESVNGFLKSMASTVDFVADSMVASEAQIIDGLLRAGSAVSQFTKSEKLNTDVTALMGSLISTGETGQYSGQIVNNLLNDLYTNKDNKIGNVLKKSKQEYNAQVVADPMVILDQLFAKYEKLSPVAKTTFAKNMGFDEVSGKVFQKYQDEKFRKNLSEGREGATGAYKAADRLDSAFGKSMEGTYKQWDRFKQILIVIAQVIGGIFLPGINAVLKALNYVLDPMTTLIAGMIEFGAKIPGAKLIATVVSLAALAGAIAVVATVIAPLVAGWLGITAALAGVGGVMGLVTASIAAFSGAFSAVIGVIGTIAGILGGPITILLAVGAALAYVAYKTGFLSKAFDKFKGSEIGKDLLGVWEGIKAKFGELVAWLGEKWDSFMSWLGGGGKAGDSALAGLFGWLGGMFDKLDGFYKKLKTPEGMAGLKKGLSVVAMAAFPVLLPIKILTLLVEWLTKIFSSTDPLADLLEYALDIWEKVKGVLQALWDTVTGFGQWIKDILGITKNEKKAALDKAVAAESKASGSNYKYVVDEKDSELGMYTGWKKGSERISSTELPPSIQKALEDYNQAPPGLGEQIANALKGVLPSWWAGGGEPPAETPAAPSDEPPAEEGPGFIERGMNWLKGLFGGGDDDRPDKETWIAEQMSMNPSLSRANAEASYEYNYPGFAVGATFSKGGLFRGIVDPTEEIIPQAITQRGPGPLSQILSQIYGSSAGGSSTPAGVGNFSQVNHFHINKIDSEADIDRLASAVLEKSRSGILDLTARHGGYLRGGAVYR